MSNRFRLKIISTYSYIFSAISLKRAAIAFVTYVILTNSIKIKNDLFIADLENALNINDETRASVNKIIAYGQQPYGILFVTAHPDDETMFFIPTIMLIKDYIKSYDTIEPPIKIYLLVFTNGNYYGKGEEREKDLVKNCYKLGISEYVIHDPEIYDGSHKWPLDRISKIINEFVQENNVRTIFTFDRFGVSYHINHSSVCNGVEMAVDSMPGFWTFHLKTVSIFRKYLSIISLYFPIFLDKSAALYISPMKVFKLMRNYKTEWRIHVPFWCFLSSYAYSNSYDIYVTPDDRVSSSFWKKSGNDKELEGIDL